VNTTGTSESETTGVSETHGKSPLGKHRFVTVPNGKTLVAAADQLYAVMNLLAAMPDRTLLCRVRGLKTPFMLHTHEVGDPFREAGYRYSDGWKEMEVEDFVRRVREAHPFYFVPDEERRRSRVERFIFGDVRPDATVDGSDDRGPDEDGDGSDESRFGY
jgi:hypothetical protein